MKKILFLLVLFFSTSFAQYNSVNQWYEIRMDGIDKPDGIVFAEYNKNDQVTISWDHIGAGDTTGVWYPLIGSTHVFQVNNGTSIWSGNQASYTFSTVDMSAGYYQLRMRTYGGFPEAKFTAYSESVYFLSIQPAQVPGGLKF